MMKGMLHNCPIDLIYKVWVGQSAVSTAALVVPRSGGIKFHITGAGVGGLARLGLAKSEDLEVRECVQMCCKQSVIVPF